jgi:hypothetical protein
MGRRPEYGRHLAISISRCGDLKTEDTFPAIAFARIAFANMPAKAQIGCDAATQQNQQRP